jgi:TonB family protein
MRKLWVFTAQAAVLAAAGLAMAQEAVGDIAEPVWVTQPSRASFRYPFNYSDYRPLVRLRCTVAGDVLDQCQPIDPTPESFLGAAIDAAATARIAPLDAHGAPTNGREVTVSIPFPPRPIPVAIDPPPAPPNPSFLTNVTWLERPGSDQFLRFYPPAALEQQLPGRVTIDCLVSADGRLSCTALSEEPQGLGFGEAALRVSRHFRMAAQTTDGRRTAGGRVRQVIRFSIADAPPQ